MMIVGISDKWEKEIIFRQSIIIFITKILRIIFFLLWLILIIILFFNYKEIILSLSSSLYFLCFVIITFFINSFFLFLLLELTKFFFWLHMLIWDLFSIFKVWNLFSDNIDFMHLDDIWDFKFKKSHIFEILFNFWKIILDDNELESKVLYRIDKPDKIVELLVREKLQINSKV